MWSIFAHWAIIFLSICTLINRSEMVFLQGQSGTQALQRINGTTAGQKTTVVSPSRTAPCDDEDCDVESSGGGSLTRSRAAFKLVSRLIDLESGNGTSSGNHTEVPGALILPVHPKMLVIMVSIGVTVVIILLLVCAICICRKRIRVNIRIN